MWCFINQQKEEPSKQDYQFIVKQYLAYYTLRVSARKGHHMAITKSIYLFLKM